MERKSLNKRDRLTIKITPQSMFYEIELFKDGKLVAHTTTNPNDADAKIAAKKLKASYLHEKVEEDDDEKD
jgi:hypothetical protein